MRYAVVVVVLAGCGGERSELVVPTTTGDVRGVLEGEAMGVRAFRGIPFAAPPVGDLRWRPPAPAVAWDGELDGSEPGPMCPQLFTLQPGGGEEDCLYLNVWTPSPAPIEPVPVMFWIHGGGFTFGSGGDDYYAGTRLTETRGVVVVTINYRLGPLGYLAHPALAAEDPDHPTSGNYGVEDQIAALDWVHREIAGFGGDPDRVMVFGESAGGFSACLHYVSPRAGEQFHAVISESGLCTADDVERDRATAEAQGSSFAAELGCAGTGADAIACLRALDPFAILDAGGAPPINSQLPGGPFYQDADSLAWAPVVDGVVVPASTRDAFAAGGHAALSLIVGSNRDEGTLFHSSFLGKKVLDEAELRAALERRFGATAADAIVAQYPVADFATPNDALAEISGDAFFVCPARRTARGAAAAGAPVYLYTFQHELEGALLTDGGVIHAAEIPFVFGIDTFPLGSVGEAGRPLSDAIQAYWSAFATAGDPAVAGQPAWPRYDAASDQHVVLDDPITASSAHKTARCDFWDAM